MGARARRQATAIGSGNSQTRAKAVCPPFGPDWPVHRIAHEIRNSVFAITANLDALEAEPDPGLALPEYVGELTAASERLRDLVSALAAGAPPSAEDRSR